MTEWSELDALEAASGETWVRRRDALLASGDEKALAARLTPLATASDAKRAVTAQILLGWIAHRALYLQVLKQLDAVDVAHEGRKASGLPGVWLRFADLAREEWGPPVLPLAWEMALVRTDWPMWKVVTGLHMIGALPDARSVPVLLQVIERTEDDGVRRLAGQQLARMPKEATREPVERARKRAENVNATLRRAAEELAK